MAIGDDARSTDYIRRTLTYTDAEGVLHTIDQRDLTVDGAPLVVLGEPGMGKTWLLRDLAADTDRFVFKTAKSFVRQAEPARLLRTGQTLVIDAVDEIPASREQDPVHQVLAKLSEAGFPPFILSCRGADWRGAIASYDIEDEYGAAPREVRLDPLQRQDALAYLAATVEGHDPNGLLDRLDQQSMGSLYGNPLTLKLLARVINEDQALPESRVALYEKICALLGRENNERRPTAPLARLDPDTILDAAGAACAALILTGAEAISLHAPGDVDADDLHIARVAALPGAEALETVLGSGLFERLLGGDRQAYFHRSIAEYLGARWLASRLEFTSRRRLIDLITHNEGVPASLRGLHAWLAHFDAELAAKIIDTDPYGVLRYGDADRLSLVMAERLLTALRRLDQIDPRFRSGDWSRHSAISLARLELTDPIRNLLLDPASSFHLRTLVLDFVEHSPIVSALADTLLIIAHNAGGAGQAFSYAERRAAADALIADRHLEIDWPAQIERLRQSNTEDGRRLAVELLVPIGFENLSDTAIADVALGYLGLLPGQTHSAERSTLGDLYGLGRRLPVNRIPAVLDCFVQRITPGERHEHSVRYAINDLVMALVSRLIVTEEPEPVRLWRWLKLSSQRDSLSDRRPGEIAAFITARDALRRSIQRQALLVETDEEFVSERAWRLGEVMQALRPSTDDIVFLLGELLTITELDDPARRIQWRDLARLAANQDGLAETIISAVEPFIDDETDRTYLEALTHPTIPEWQRRDAIRNAREAAVREGRWRQHRENFQADLEGLRRGDPGRIASVALAYLGRYNDLDNESALGRVTQWLGEPLARAAVEGLEAVLHRPDIPSSQTIADHYRRSVRPPGLALALLAGLALRIDTGMDFSGIAEEQLISARIELDYDNFDQKPEGKALVTALDAWFSAHPESAERYARTLIEPQLIAQHTYVSGLYALLKSNRGGTFITALAAEWLERFPQLAAEPEYEIVEHLARAGRWDVIETAAAARRTDGYRDEEHRRTWLAIEFPLRFDAIREDLDAVAAIDPSFLWTLRNRAWLGGRDGAGRSGPLNSEALAWIVRTFRASYPYAERFAGPSGGDTNDFDATNYLESIIQRLASATDDAAASALDALKSGPTDGYTATLLNARAQQVKAQRDAQFMPPTLAALSTVLNSGPPTTVADVRAVALDVLDRLQSQLRGDDIGRVNLFYDNGIPLTENVCRDRLTALIEAALPFGIQSIPERAMPNGRRADLALLLGDLQLPIEMKGQWNPQVWSAANDQLDAFYSIEWRAQNVGIYLVFWFGPDAPAGRRLRLPPAPETRPASPEGMKVALESSLPEHRRGDVAVVVLDVSPRLARPTNEGPMNAGASKIGEDS
jgi:hypothetical protein